MTTKKQRVADLTATGMTNAEAAFQVAKEDLEAQERAVEKAAIDIIKSDFSDTWEAALATARETVLKPKRRRKTTKKADTEDTVKVTDSVTESVDQRTAYTGF